MSSKNEYVIMTGNSTIMAIEKPRRVKKTNDPGCSKQERDQWMNFQSKKIKNANKKQRDLEILKEQNARNARKKGLNEFLFYYGLCDENKPRDKATINTIKDLRSGPFTELKDVPDKCLDCGSVDFYKKSHIDDIKLICGVCGRPAFILPGHGYDWQGNKIN